MSMRIGNVTIIEAEDDKKCQICGAISECRPYGPEGQQICYDCAMKDPIGTEIRMAKALFDDDLTVEEAKERMEMARKINEVIKNE